LDIEAGELLADKDAAMDRVGVYARRVRGEEANLSQKAATLARLELNKFESIFGEVAGQTVDLGEARVGKCPSRSQQVVNPATSLEHNVEGEVSGLFEGDRREIFGHVGVKSRRRGDAKVALGIQGTFEEELDRFLRARVIGHPFRLGADALLIVELPGVCRCKERFIGGRTPKQLRQARGSLESIQRNQPSLLNL